MLSITSFAFNFVHIYLYIDDLASSRTEKSHAEIAGLLDYVIIIIIECGGRVQNSNVHPRAIDPHERNLPSVIMMTITKTMIMTQFCFLRRGYT